MTPQDFIAKWRNVELKERTASHSHFIDLCALLEVPDPITADPTGEWFTFEKGASKTGGGEGWADVWRRDCFAWEYKGRRRDLDAAFTQLQRYAIALDNPPLLIVSDMDRIRIHTNWTNTVQKVHTVALEDLTDAAVRDRLRDCFLNPEALRPAKTRAVLTEEAAQRFADLAQRLRGRGHDAQAVAHFVNRPDIYQLLDWTRDCCPTYLKMDCCPTYLKMQSGRNHAALVLRFLRGRRYGGARPWLGMVLPVC